MQTNFKRGAEHLFHLRCGGKLENKFDLITHDSHNAASVFASYQNSIILLQQKNRNKLWCLILSHHRMERTKNSPLRDILLNAGNSDCI